MNDEPIRISAPGTWHKAFSNVAATMETQGHGPRLISWARTVAELQGFIDEEQVRADLRELDDAELGVVRFFCAGLVVYGSERRILELALFGGRVRDIATDELARRAA